MSNKKAHHVAGFGVLTHCYLCNITRGPPPFMASDDDGDYGRCEFDDSFLSFFLSNIVL
ncbi:hypothetical protein HQ585_21260 [candidate division KSB1 bacterium]|nr:hypothetical protein [candidate division KSB1 bacterium]